MKRFTLLATALCTLLAVISCEKKPLDPYKGLEKVSFTESDALIANPERGFYSTVETHNAGKVGINQAKIDVARSQGRTLFLLEYYLTDYMDKPIADDYLNIIRANFQALREGGAKALVRFAYKNGYADSDWPYDAPEDIVLGHVAQLKPILQEFGDVLFCLQAGFVGSWGEWYYTSYFNMNPATQKAYEPRKHLLDALLDAVPEDRQIEVRTPTFKMKIYGYALADTLTAAEAHTNTIKARIGGHNDCFLASENDTGTFHNQTERNYWQAETRYTIMGGESCGTSSYCDCDNGTRPGAVEVMENYHFTYLHIGYHPAVLALWRKNGCFSEIENRMGYRLVLRDCYFTTPATAGSDFRIVLNIDNVGFASPMNPREAEFVLTDASGKVLQTYEVKSDPRTWHSNEDIVIDQTIQLPASASGNVKLYLNLPDPKPALRSNPRFSIQLANEGVWEEATGYNLIKTISL